MVGTQFGLQTGYNAPITQVKNKFPGFSDDDIKKLEDKTKDIVDPIEKAKIQNEIYRKVLPIVQQQKQLQARDEGLNELSYQAEQQKDQQKKGVMSVGVKMGELGNAIKTKFNLPANAPDDEIIQQFIAQTRNGEQMLVDYVNNKSEELLYVSGLKERPVEKEDTNILKNVGIGIGAGIGGLGLLKGGGMVAESIGKGIYGLTLPPGMDEARAIQTYNAGLGEKPRTTVSSAIERPMVGTRTMIGTQAQKQANKIFTKTINPILEKSKTKINIKSLISDLGKDIVKLAKGDPDKLKEYSEAFEEMKKSFSERKFNNLGLKDTHELKSGLQSRTPQKFFKGKEITNAYKELRGKLSSKLVNGLHTSIAKEFGIDSAKLYKDYANLKGLAEVGVKSRSQAGIKGGFGGFWTTIAQELATPATTLGGKATYKAGQLAQKIPDLLLKGAKTGIKGIKTIGKGLLAIDPINAPELLKYVPGTIGESFQEYIKTNPASIVMDKLFNPKSELDIKEELKKEFPGIDDKTIEQVIKGEKILLQV